MISRLRPFALLLFALLLLAGGWSPAAHAEARGHPREDVPAPLLRASPDGRDLPLLVQPPPRLPQVRKVELFFQYEKPSPHQAAGHPACLSLLPQAAPASFAGRLDGFGFPPLRPSWRGLAFFPLPPPSAR